MKKKRPGMAHFYKKNNGNLFCYGEYGLFCLIFGCFKKQFNNNGEEISMQIPMLGLELTTSQS